VNWFGRAVPNEATNLLLTDAKVIDQHPPFVVIWKNVAATRRLSESLLH